MAHFGFHFLEGALRQHTATLAEVAEPARRIVQPRQLWSHNTANRKAMSCEYVRKIWAPIPQTVNWACYRNKNFDAFKTLFWTTRKFKMAAAWQLHDVTSKQCAGEVREKLSTGIFFSWQSFSNVSFWSTECTTINYIKCAWLSHRKSQPAATISPVLSIHLQANHWTDEPGCPQVHILITFVSVTPLVARVLSGLQLHNVLRDKATFKLSVLRTMWK